MRGVITRHWSYIPAGAAVAILLMAFWSFNQGYLGIDKGMVASFLEKPLPTFALIIFGAYVASSLSGEFSVKAPVTYEAIFLSMAGGLVAGIGATVAEMSVHSAVLFNLAGVFTLPAFMITKGWVYIVFMVAGGAVGSRLLLLVIAKTGHLKRHIVVPRVIGDRKVHRIVFRSLVALFGFIVLVTLLLPQPGSYRAGLPISMVLLALFGFVVERGTICMSSMLKEWFISHTSYVWRSVLFAIMCLALLYQLGLLSGLFEPVAVERFVSDPALLMTGSFLLGFGFIFADGCFIGSLWKAGQGNLINVSGVIGLLIGIGMSQAGMTLIGAQRTGSTIPGDLSSMIRPLWFVMGLWLAGTILLLIFRERRYRY